MLCPSILYPISSFGRMCSAGRFLSRKASITSMGHYLRYGICLEIFFVVRKFQMQIRTTHWPQDDFMARRVKFPTSLAFNGKFYDSLGYTCKISGQLGPLGVNLRSSFIAFPGCRILALFRISRRPTTFGLRSSPIHVSERYCDTTGFFIATARALWRTYSLTENHVKVR